ncbi:DivIVA domain-containing protein [Gardnerella vaginalis]|uniref:DivIVA domain repeat protein n=1 Tax=Gardnerella vaginalis TaxID=2702 RepID=A0A133NM34_GARVA|nr:DivIVA domain-containing protein [Gardnerella vaginalis]KXA17342.1 DivIVA domain repeat protein [Gardnerella vaginalis]
MASKPDTARNSSGIERVGKRKKGYSVEQVNDFLERAHSLYESNDISLTQKDIQDVSFDLEDEGYAIPQVDAALSRLERAVVDKTTQYEISNRGKVVWKAQADEEYRVLLSHSKRDYKMRFDCAKSRKPSYDKKQVDNVVDKSLDKIAVLLGYNPVWGNSLSDLDKIDAMFVSNVLFTQRSGKRGYDERQVDYYLNACVRLLSRLESYDRVSKYSDFDSSESVESGNFGGSATVNNGLQESAVNAAAQAPAEPKAPVLMPPSIPVEHHNEPAANDSVPNVYPKSSEQDFADSQDYQESPQDKQSVFAHVDNSVNENNDDYFSDLHHADKAIFTPHSAGVEPSDDTDDEMSQASTVMPPAFPPSYAPQAANSNNDADSSSYDSYNQSNNGNNGNGSKTVGDLNLSLLASPKFEPSHSLNLDIPDLSFPVMNHFDASMEDSSSEENKDSDGFDDTGESNFGGFVNPNHN